MWPSAPRRPLAGLHLLVVDDADAILLAYGEILRRAGASVATAGDGTDACTAYEEARRSGLPFDAVVLDYVMPGLDGVEATARLRGCGFEGPIVGISAEVTNEDEDRWLAAGCDRVVCKGLPSEELVRSSPPSAAAHTGDDRRPPNTTATRVPRRPCRSAIAGSGGRLGATSGGVYPVVSVP